MHVAVFFQKKKFHNFMSDEERWIICKVFKDIFHLSTYL